VSLLDRLRERAAPEQSDAGLNALIGALRAEIDARLGPVGQITLELGDAGEPEAQFFRTLRLPQPVLAGSALTVKERSPANSGAGSDEVVLTGADFRLVHGGRTLQRLTTGPNPNEYWAPLVTISFTPATTPQPVRDEALIKLATLDLSYRGMIKSERAGDYQWSAATGTSEGYSAEREAIFASLVSQQGLVLA
jgi:hypothetical protein